MAISVRAESGLSGDPNGTKIRRNSGQGARSDMPSAPLARHHRIHIVAPATGTDQPLAPIGNGNVGAVSFGHFGGIWFGLMAALAAPYDEPHKDSPPRSRARSVRSLSNPCHDREVAFSGGDRIVIRLCPKPNSGPHPNDQRENQPASILLPASFSIHKNESLDGWNVFS